MSTTHLNVDADFDQQRIDVYLTKVLPDTPSRSFVQKLIEGGHVLVNGKRVKSHDKIQAGEKISVDIPADFIEPSTIPPENISLDIFYEDDHLFVINKPIGMMVHPAKGCYSGTLVNALLYHAKELSDINTDIRPGIVHRLDKETSGLILVAKDNVTHARLAKQFQRHEVKKHYVALVEGEMEFDEGMVDAPLGRHRSEFSKKAVRFDDDDARDAVTYYRVIKRYHGVTLVSLFPKTGRTHQLRVHMAHLRHPILGDDKYGHPKTFPRLALHAKSIAFRHPFTKAVMEFFSTTPAEFLKKVDL